VTYHITTCSEKNAEMVSAQSQFTETRYYIKKSAGVGKAALQLRNACTEKMHND